MDVGDEGYAVAPENPFKRPDIVQQVARFLPDQSIFNLSEVNRGSNDATRSQRNKILYNQCLEYGLAKFNPSIMDEPGKMPYDRQPDVRVYQELCNGKPPIVGLTELQKRCRDDAFLKEVTCNKSYYAKILTDNGGEFKKKMVINIAIPAMAHSGDAKIEFVELGDKVFRIGKEAFYDSGALKMVKGGKNLRFINDSAFKWCVFLKTIQFGDRLETIGSQAFSGCEELKTIKFGGRLEFIGNRAFEWCKMLESIDIPDSVKKIGKFCFCVCTNVKNIRIGAGIRSIPEQAFSNIHNLESLTIPQNVLEIHKSAFEWCRLLKKVIIKGASYIAEKAFASCYRLEEVIIGEGLKKIGYKAFFYCRNLKKVTLPSSIEEIHTNAFRRTYKYLQIVMDNPTKFQSLNLLGKFGPHAKFVQKK